MLESLHLFCVGFLLGGIVGITDLLPDVFVDHAPAVKLRIRAGWKLLVCIHLLEFFGEVHTSSRFGAIGKHGVVLTELLLTLLFLHLAEEVTLRGQAGLPLFHGFTSGLFGSSLCQGCLSGFPLVLHHLEHAASVLFFLFFFKLGFSNLVQLS